MQPISIFWFRRDLRLEDNTALFHALSSSQKVQPIFIFDDQIIRELPANDARLTFIYENLNRINQTLSEYESSLLILKGNPVQVWKELLQRYSVQQVFVNKDYEPYAIQRDREIEQLLQEKNISFSAYKDQVIHEENEVLKKDGTPYTVFTPYKNKWLEVFAPLAQRPSMDFENLHSEAHDFPSMEELGLQQSTIKVLDYKISQLDDYHKTRDYPHLNSTSYLSPHLRFGTVSIRHIVAQLKGNNEVFLSELIWREFFMQILFHFPKVVTQNFRSKYDGIQWENNTDDFAKWCKGETGYPMVDAGMRQLNETGYMHNRVRMITAGFLCKHLLIDWRWGEAYFAKKLLDYELSSNNGNWQWAAGAGCDAAPYFRIFNPIEQLKKFDAKLEYVKHWIPEYGTPDYPKPMVEHKFARLRALDRYKVGIEGNTT